MALVLYVQTYDLANCDFTSAYHRAVYKLEINVIGPSSAIHQPADRYTSPDSDTITHSQETIFCSGTTR